jgi:two-component system CheB/CheR fusion protein
MTYNSMFVPVDLKRRIFTKVPKGNHIRDRQMGLVRTSGEEMASQLVSHVRLREVAFETGSVAQLVVEFGGLLALANEKARAMFGLEPADLGRPFQDLQISYRPADLRSCIDRVYLERKPAKLAEIEWSLRAGDVCYLDIHVVPLLDPVGTPIGVAVTFVDATANRRLQEELQTSHKALEVAYEELQSTNSRPPTRNSSRPMKNSKP